MITITNVNNDLNTLKIAIDTSGFLDGETVTVETGQTSEYDSYTYNVLTIKDADANTLFRYEQRDSDLHRGRWMSYAASSLTSNNNDGNARSIQSVGSCKNGIIVIVGWGQNYTQYYTPIRIVRTNLGKLAFIHSTGTENAYSAQCCVTWGDVSPLRDLTFNVSNRMQAVVAPMVTNSEYDVLSQTVKSGWMPYNRDYTVYLRAMTLNGHRFLTDGYFAIEDEG